MGNINITNEDIKQLISQAIGVVNESVQYASSQNFGDDIKNQIYANSSVIQGLIDSFLSNQGVMTQEQLNQLDETVRIQKMKMLELKSRQTKTKFAIFIGATILVVATIWYIKKSKG